MQFIFRNRWIALIWACSVLGSIAMFVSDGGGGEKLGESVAALNGNSGTARPKFPSNEERLREDGSLDDGFASDDEVMLTDEEREAKAARLAAATTAAKQAAAKALASTEAEPGL